MSVEQHTPFAAAAAFIAEQPQPRVTVPARCVLVGPTAVEVRLGGRAITVGEPQALGGQGTAPTPEQYALAAFGACETITFRYWSGRLAIPVDGLRVEVRGDIDPGASLGLAHGVRPGYGAVRIAVRVWGPAPAERYDQLLGAVDEHASVLDVFRNEVRVETIDGGLRVGRCRRRRGRRGSCPAAHPRRRCRAAISASAAPSERDHERLLVPPRTPPRRPPTACCPRSSLRSSRRST